MSDPIQRLPARPSLEQLRKQAKGLSRSAGMPLHQAQLDLARRYGFASWPKLVHHVVATGPSGEGRRLYEVLAGRLATAYTTGDFTAIREINWELGTAFVWDRDTAQMQQRLPTWFAAPERTPELAVDDARRLVAQRLGFESWEALIQSLIPVPRQPDAPPTDAPFFRIDRSSNTIDVRGPIPTEQWGHGSRRHARAGDHGAPRGRDHRSGARAPGRARAGHPPPDRGRSGDRHWSGPCGAPFTFGGARCRRAQGPNHR